MRRAAAGLVLVLVTACGPGPRAGPAPTTTTVPSPPAGSATVLLGGDVMLGREVGEVAAADPSSLFEEFLQGAW